MNKLEMLILQLCVLSYIHHTQLLLLLVCIDIKIVDKIDAMEQLESRLEQRRCHHADGCTSTIPQ